MSKYSPPGDSKNKSIEPLEPRILLSNTAFAPVVTLPFTGFQLEATGDFTGDGKTDILALYTKTLTLELLAGNGDGTFKSPQTIGVLPGKSYSIITPDLNGDGRPDILATNTKTNTGQTVVFLNEGGGAFSSAISQTFAANFNQVVVADVNGDGVLDLLAPASTHIQYTNNLTATITELLGNGNGTFQPATTVASIELSNNGQSTGSTVLAAADLTGDGHVDAVLAYESSDTFAVFLGNGNGTFGSGTTFATVPELEGLTLLDLNGDGKPDLFGVNFEGNAVDVQLNNGNGTFQSPQTFAVGSLAAPYSIPLADFNGDGATDLALPLLGDDTVAVLQGNGNGTFQPPLQFNVGLKPLFAFAGDFNGDGKPDLVVEDGNVSGEFSFNILINKTGEPGAGGQVFPPPPPNIPLASAGSALYVGSQVVQLTSADVNGDGKPDVIEESFYEGTLSILVALGNGNGTYAPASVVQTISPAINGNSGTRILGIKRLPLDVVDVNGDGIPDIVTVQYSFPYPGNNKVSQLVVMLGNGNGTFQAPIAGPPINGFTRAFAVGDLNGDGKPDIVEETKFKDKTTSTTTFSLNVLLGNGNGTFGSPSTLAFSDLRPIAMDLADLNGDGKLDLISADGYYSTVSVLLGNGNGTFAAPATYATLAGDDAMAVADLNHDGRPDIITADFEVNAVSVLLNNGNGTFQPQTTYAVGSLPGFVAVGDINGDGIPDLVVPNPLDNTFSVLLGSGNGTFAGQQVFDTTFDPSEVFLHDVNGDGKTDVLAWDAFSDSIAGSIQVFLNNQPRIAVNGGILNIVGTTAADTIQAGLSADTITVTVDSTTQTIPGGQVDQIAVFGGAGSDTISIAGLPIPATISGAGGNDSFTGGADADSLRGGGGNDTLGGAGGDDTVVGGAGNDCVKGGAGDDFISGGPGNDIVHGGIGDDTLTGGAGDDTVNGNAGNDSVYAGSGASQLLAGPGNDTITGSISNGDLADTIFCGTGADSVVNGSGDLIEGQTAEDTIVAG